MDPPSFAECSSFCTFELPIHRAQRQPVDDNFRQSLSATCLWQPLLDRALRARRGARCPCAADAAGIGHLHLSPTMRFLFPLVAPNRWRRITRPTQMRAPPGRAHRGPPRRTQMRAPVERCPSTRGSEVRWSRGRPAASRRAAANLAGQARQDTACVSALHCAGPGRRREQQPLDPAPLP